jgi:magnesium-transporting ATPase (P-type)
LICPPSSTAFGCAGYSLSNKAEHYTIIFQTFMFMLFFNEINCRRIGMKETNPFANFFSNWYFIIVLVATIIMQLLLTNLLKENVIIQVRIT